MSITVNNKDLVKWAEMANSLRSIAAKERYKYKAKEILNAVLELERLAFYFDDEGNPIEDI